MLADMFVGYPNVWSEFVPFMTQMTALLRNNSPEESIRKIMVDYDNNHELEVTKKYEKFFVAFMKTYFTNGKPKQTQLP